MSDTGRVEAFSDGVLAIAITLLVLDLPVPRRHDDGSLLRELAHEWPAFAAYVVSFLVIGIIWVNHHAVFKLIARVDRTVLFLNLLLLMFVVAIPFTTRLMSAYLTAGRDARTAAVMYSAVMLAMGLAFGALYLWVVHRPELLAPTVDAIAARRSVRRFAVGNAVYLAAIGVALVSAPLCLVFHLVIALYYCFEQTGGWRA